MASTLRQQYGEISPAATEGGRTAQLKTATAEAHSVAAAEAPPPVPRELFVINLTDTKSAIMSPWIALH